MPGYPFLALVKSVKVYPPCCPWPLKGLLGAGVGRLFTLSPLVPCPPVPFLHATGGPGGIGGGARLAAFVCDSFIVSLFWVRLPFIPEPLPGGGGADQGGGLAGGSRGEPVR